MSQHCDHEESSTSLFSLHVIHSVEWYPIIDKSDWVDSLFVMIPASLNVHGYEIRKVQVWQLKHHDSTYSELDDTPHEIASKTRPHEKKYLDDDTKLFSRKFAKSFLILNYLGEWCCLIWIPLIIDSRTHTKLFSSRKFAKSFLILNYLVEWCCFWRYYFKHSWNALFPVAKGMSRR